VEKRISLLQSGSRYLAKEGIEGARRESEIFLSHTLNCPRVELYLNNFNVEEKVERDFWQLLSSRARGEPLQYLLKKTEFMGLEFKMATDVFIPRPETEILVENIIQAVSSDSRSLLKILDVGTGCGNIAISLAKHLPQAHIFACDISNSALQLTEENARLNGISLNLVKSDVFSAFFNKRNYFSLIVSNPPYVCANEIPYLSRELQHEPKKALDGGLDGLRYYHRIIEEAPGYLAENGLLALEIGDDQGFSVQQSIKKNTNLLLNSTIKDYNDRERVVLARKA